MQRDHARVGRARLTYHSEYNSGSILSRRYNPIRSNTAVNSAWFHAPGKVLQETLVDHDLVLEAHRENMALTDSANPSGCDTTRLYISSRKEPHLSGGDYPQKKHGKAVYTHNGGDFCLQASHRLPASPVCWLSHQSKTAKERNPVARDSRTISNQIVKEKYKVYIPTSPQEFYKIHSIHPLAEKKEGGGTNQSERLTCALRAMQAKKEEIHPREGNFTAASYLQQGKTRTNNQIADSEQDLRCTSQGPGENEPQARRKYLWTKRRILSGTSPHGYLILSLFYRAASVSSFFSSSPKPIFEKNCKLRAPFSHLIRPRNASQTHASRKGSREARARLASRARCGPRMWHLSPVPIWC